MLGEIAATFPRLAHGAYQVTSPATEVYNCVAWAAGDTSRWWWPDDPRGYWPPGISTAESIEAFRDAFSSLGYAVCPNEDWEAGFERVALFAQADGRPTHAARQLPDGSWTSKLGLLEDIRHSLYDLEGTAYGSVVAVMKRRR